MFEHSLLEQAQEKKHMTAKQAATIARDGNVDKLALIHYSPRYTDYELKKLLDEAVGVFPSTVLSKDRMNFQLLYQD